MFVLYIYAHDYLIAATEGSVPMMFTVLVYSIGPTHSKLAKAINSKIDYATSSLVKYEPSKIGSPK